LPRPAPFSLLYPILDAAFETRDNVAVAVRALAAAGCRLVQLRAKELSSRELLEWAEIAVEAARPSGTHIIVNDRADVALIAGASGVHVGQDDLSVASVRRVLGDDAIVGVSTHNLEQARAADGLDVDYVAIGPAFATRTKARADPTLGPDGIRRVRDVVGKPLVAIGGITHENARELLATGVDGLAVISALKTDAGLENEARRWLALHASNASTP
jgi:thiamine-phosphate pyrophosphorylase